MREADAGEDHRHEAKSSDCFGEPLRSACPRFLRRLDERQRKHEMRGDRAKHAADDLRRNVGARLAGRKIALQRKDERHRRIEMCAGDRREDRDQDDEDRACRERIAEKRKRGVLRQRFRHDAGADNRCHQERRAERFRREAAA